MELLCIDNKQLTVQYTLKGEYLGQSFGSVYEETWIYTFCTMHRIYTLKLTADFIKLLPNFWFVKSIYKIRV